MGTLCASQRLGELECLLNLALMFDERQLATVCSFLENLRRRIIQAD